MSQNRTAKKVAIWSLVIAIVTLVIISILGIIPLIPKPEGKKLFLQFQQPLSFNLNCLIGIQSDYPKINITATKLGKIETDVGYVIEQTEQIKNTCGNSSSFFIYNRQVCYIAIKEGPTAYKSISSCSSYHPPPTDEPLTIQLNDLSNESSTFTLLAFTQNFPTCKIIEKIKVCPIFENKEWDDQCTNEAPVEINYRGC